MRGIDLMNHEKTKLIIKGIVTAIVFCMLLMVAVRTLLPQFMDPYPEPSKNQQAIGNMIGFAVWAISLGVGIGIIAKDWKKN
jgi:cytochrome c oxidase assembly factor CtaG